MSFLATALFAIVTTAAWLALVVFIARRLVGIRVGPTRALLAGLVGLTFFFTFGLLVQTRADNPWAFATIQVGLSVLVVMGVFVVAEVLVPHGSGMGVITWRRAWRRRVGRSRRYLQIVAIALRHGLVPFSRRRRRALADGTGREAMARSLRLALEEGGVTFVKLGQLLSTRRDLLPPEIVDELATLQDRATPEPWEQVERVLHEELGAPFDDVYAEIDRTPVAAASIAQVHAATLSSGESVVVKVQRPDIRSVIERDMDIIARLALSLEHRTRWGRQLGVVDLARGFATAINEELDFRIEARNIMGVATAAARRGGDGQVRLPTLHERLCTERVLVMERLDGVSLGAAAGLMDERGLDRSNLARALLHCLLAEIVLDGVFHADPHPGNILLLQDGQLGLLDFGSVGRLDPAMQSGLQQLLIALDRHDPAGARDALVDVLASTEDVDERQLERSLGQFMVQHLGPAASPDAEMFTDLFRMVSDHGLAVPPEVAAVFRAMATLEGTLAHLAPGFEILEETRGYAKVVLREQLAPTSLKQAATDELTALLPVLRPLPRRVARLTTALERGELTFRVRLFADERDRRFLRSVVQQVVLAFLGATTGLTGVLLLGTSGGPEITPTISLFDVLGYNLLVVSVVLVLRALLTSFRRRD